MNEQKVDIERVRGLDEAHWHTRPGAEIKRTMDALLAELDRLRRVERALTSIQVWADTMPNRSMSYEITSRIDTALTAPDAASQAETKEEA